jgi:hypothetical protein
MLFSSYRLSRGLLTDSAQVNDCNRQPFAYVRELKQKEATQTWGRVYEYQILFLNKSVSARTQVTPAAHLVLRFASSLIRPQPSPLVRESGWAHGSVAAYRVGCNQ